MLTIYSFLLFIKKVDLSNLHHSTGRLLMDNGRASAFVNATKLMTIHAINMNLFVTRAL